MTPPPSDSHDSDVFTSTSNISSSDTVREHFIVTTSMPLQQHIAILSIHNPELETIAPTATVVYSTEEAGIDLETVQGPPLSPQDPEHTREEDATPLPIATAVSNGKRKRYGILLEPWAVRSCLNTHIHMVLAVHQYLQNGCRTWGW